MHDEPSIVKEMRARENQEHFRLKDEHALTDQPQTQDLFKDDERVDELWFQMWCVL